MPMDTVFSVGTLTSPDIYVHLPFRAENCCFLCHVGEADAYSNGVPGLQEMLVGYAEAKKLQKPTTHEVAPEEGDACFPLTTERAGKQYCYDREGAIYLKYGAASHLFVLWLIGAFIVVNQDHHAGPLTCAALVQGGIASAWLTT